MKNYTFRVDPAQLPRWKRAAKAAKRSISDWIRLTCDAAASAERAAEVSAQTRESPAKPAVRARAH
jgi:hypothetical protein